MKRILFGLAVPFVLAAATPAMAQTGGQCAALGDDAERLACYDGIFRTGDAPASGDSVTLQSEQLIPARPSGRAPATITVSCDAGNLRVAFGFAGNTLSALGNDTGITLQYDLQQRRSFTLPVDATNTAAIIQDAAQVRTFLDGFIGADNLTVRVTPASTRSLNVRFNVSQFGETVEPVVAACE